MSTGPGAHNGYGLLVPDQFVGGCRYITIQTIQKLSDSGEDVKVRGTRKAGVSFRVRSFLIQHARLSRNLEQANVHSEKILSLNDFYRLNFDRFHCNGIMIKADCLQSAFSLKTPLLLISAGADYPARLQTTKLCNVFPASCLIFACGNFTKKNKRLLAVKIERVLIPIQKAIMSEYHKL